MSDQSTIRLVSYDPAWPRQYNQERYAIAAALGGHLVQIEYIGSTSIPGLDAKPVIDIQAEVAGLRCPEQYGELLSSSGFLPIDSGENDVRVAMRKRGSVDANLHIVQAGSWAAQRTLLLRDALRSEPVLAREYGELKRELAAETDFLLTYTLSKTEFIERVIRDRCLELGVAYNPGNRR